MTVPSTDATEVQLGESSVLLGLLAAIRVRSRSDSKIAASPKPTPGWVTAHSAGNLSTLHSLQVAQQVGACPFLVPQLV